MSMSDDAADKVFGTGTEDGQAVGAADHAADRVASGADDEGDGGPQTPYELLTGDDGPAATEDGETVGAADAEADAERSR